MKFQKAEKLLLPLMLFIFLFTYHYYDFYQSDFSKIYQHVKFTLTEKQFEQIQEFHPFYHVYKLAKETENSNQKIIYVRTRTDDTDAQFIHELNIMVDYFFYPRKVPTYSVEQFNKAELSTGTVVIIDNPSNITARKDLKDIPLIKKQLFRINRWPEDLYYIYEII